MKRLKKKLRHHMRKLKMTKIKKLEQIRNILTSSKAEFKKKYKVKELGIFGSYTRGEQKKSSDVDILVKFNHNATLFDFVGLGNYLEEKLKIKVDLVSDRGIRPEIKSNIIKGVVKV